jgi:hypothetical protein
MEHHHASSNMRRVYSKGMDNDIKICGAVIADMFVCEGWARFIHPRGDTSEATCGVFATNAGTQFYKIANPDSRCVEVEKGGDY